MKLLNVKIENFKSLKKVDVQLNDKINLLIGKNNSGKSNFIEALLFLSKIIKREHRELGRSDFERITYGKKLSNKLKYELIVSMSGDEKLKFISGFDISEDEKKKIDKLLGSKVKYVGKFDYERKIIEETAYIYLNEKETEFAKGIWEKNSYKLHIIENFVQVSETHDLKMKQAGGRSPPTSILIPPDEHNPNIPEEKLLILINDFIDNIHHLNPNRFSVELKPIVGNFKLNMDGSNLPEVLHSLASSNRQLFQRIVENTKTIIENISDIRAPIIRNSQQTYVAVVEEPFGNVEYTWDNISSGTKEIIFLVTLLNLSKKGSLLTIEEPEIHLHGEAINKFINILKGIIEKDDKQIIITTHSPIFVDLLEQENLFYVRKHDGNTDIISLSQEPNIKKMMVDEGLSMGDILVSQSPSFLIIVEGKDDYRIFNEFLRKEMDDAFKNKKINIVKPSKEGDGGSEVIKSGKFLKRTGIGMPFLMILDSDGDSGKKEQEMKNEGFRKEEYFILPEKEIEYYLIDSKALSSISKKPLEEIENVISETKGGAGKEKLKKIMNKLGIKPTSETKALIARHLETTPDDINKIITRIKNKIN